MSKFTDEQIDLMLKNDAMRCENDLRVSRAYIYESVNNRTQRAKRMKMILLGFMFAGVSIGVPILEAAIQPQPAGPPRVTYEAPGTTTTITPLNSAAEETMGGQQIIQGQPSIQTQKNTLAPSANQTNTSTNNSNPSGN